MSGNMRHLLFCILIILSAMVIGYNNDVYLGLKFDYDFVNIIFSIIEFSCISTMCKTNYRSQFCNEYILIRYRSRKRALFNEIARKIISIFGFVLLHSSIIMLIEGIGVNHYIRFIALNTLVFIFLILIQLYIELKLNTDLGYFLINIFYISGSFVGVMMYEYCTNHNGNIVDVLNSLNKINIINYTSIERLNALEINIYISIAILISLNLIAIPLIAEILKKTDIIERKGKNDN